MLVLSLTTLAYADLVSGPERCVIEAYDTAHCVVCDDPSFEDEAACQRRHGSTKTIACKTQGASVWSEIWCDTNAATTTSAPTQSRGCSTAGDGGWLAAAATATLVLRKRK